MPKHNLYITQTCEPEHQKCEKPTAYSVLAQEGALLKLKHASLSTKSVTNLLAQEGRSCISHLRAKLVRSAYAC